MRSASIACLVAFLAACGSEPSAPESSGGAVKGTVYGKGVQLPESIKVSELVARGDELVGKTVRIEGMVTDVCATRGCWFRMASDAEFQSILFKVTDGVIVFPMSMRGKYAVAEGTVRRVELGLEATRTYLAQKAEEKGEAFDPAGVTEPLRFVRLDGIGAVVRDKP